MQLRWAVHCDPRIMWLLDHEPDVKTRIRQFVADEAHPNITIAGPPDPLEQAQAVRKGKRVPLPTIVLRMRKDVNQRTGEAVVVVATDALGITEIERWRLRFFTRTGKMH